MRVLITGMGGELGTRVAMLLEADPTIEAICGIDVDPPRRRLHRATFHRLEPADRPRTGSVVQAFEPTAVVHLGIFEPNARSGPSRAIGLTAMGTVGLFAAVTACPTVDRIIVRSGIEVYGRRRGSTVRPDEDVAPDPTSPFGLSLRHVEQVATDAACDLGVPATSLRFAPIVGPHFPSPLGRLLRLPAVPVSLLGDHPFSVLHQEDAARSIVAALAVGHDGPLNVVAPGAVSVAQAARLGGRMAVPVVGPGWRGVRIGSELAGAPMPEHVRELLTRGRTAQGGRAVEVLGCAPERSTADVVTHLYEWSAVTYLDVAGAPA